MNKYVFIIALLIVPSNLISAPLTIANLSGHFVKLVIGYFQRSRMQFHEDKVWLQPNDKIETIFDLSDPDYTLGPVEAVYTQSVSLEVMNALEQEHDPGIEPKIISEKAIFMMPGSEKSNDRESYRKNMSILSEYRNHLRAAKYLPSMIITHDAEHNQPKINFPKCTEHLAAAIKQETVKAIAQEVRQDIPQFQIPAIPEIIGEYVGT